jgi:two-component system OmpR family sensor kinase
MNRSFRFELALRATAAMVAGMVAVAAVTFFALRSVLDSEIDASILNVASIQAASLTDAASGEMHFHEWELTPDEAASLRDLIRYAQVWQADGVSLLRSRFMTADLPLDREHLSRAADGALVWARARWEGSPIRTLYYPLERFGMAHERHVLQVAATLSSRNQMLSRVAGFFALLALVMAATTYAGAWWLAGRAVGPVHEIIDQALSIRGGSLDRRIQAYAGVREYRRLVEVLNGMLERIHDAFEAQRRFTADASHELRSPLTAMRGELELALRRPRHADEYQRVVESTLEEVARLSRITEDLLVLARSDSGAMEPRLETVEVGAVVSRVMDRLRGRAEEKDVVLHLRAGGGAVATVDPGLLGQVAWNLVENGVKFAPPGGEVVVSAALEDGDLVLRVADSGPGFLHPEHAFRRFFREDPARTHVQPSDGTGLGLAIVEAVAKAHGGSAEARNRPGGGAEVTVRVPAAPER